MDRHPQLATQHRERSRLPIAVSCGGIKPIDPRVQRALHRADLQRGVCRIDHQSGHRTGAERKFGNLRPLRPNGR